MIEQFIIDHQVFFGILLFATIAVLQVTFNHKVKKEIGGFTGSYCHSSLTERLSGIRKEVRKNHSNWYDTRELADEADRRSRVNQGSIHATDEQHVALAHTRGIGQPLVPFPARIYHYFLTHSPSPF